MRERTESYVFTYHPNDWNDETKLKDYKQTIKDYNKDHGTRYYVKLQGRLGKNNPNAWKYKAKKTWNAYQCIRKEDAAYFDVYVYERY